MSPDTLETLRTALFDRYRVERLLGSGGMATVYLAHDAKHDRLVAIKVLRPELSSALGPERFLREIQIAARLTHPHILPLHDSGDAGGLLYYVMPYVSGESLQERLAREKQLPVDEALRITREVASALAYAHAQDVVHRDIKPGNILLADGSALVADFGLARAISHAKSSDSLTRSGLTIGTPSYMSPEQAAGGGLLDGRSDIYSLGCVLYELLAGDPPFTASNPTALIARHLGAAPVPIRTIRPAVPRAVERALQRALEKTPADRFQSGEAFATALAPEQMAKEAPAIPRWITYGALAMAAAAVALIVWTRQHVGDGVASGLGLDTTRYAVLPFDYAPDVKVQLNERQLLQDALSEWTGIRLADRVRLEEALRGQGGSSPSRVQAGRIARATGSGRYLRGEVTRLGDSLRVLISLSDAAVDQDPLAEAVVKVPATLAGLEPSLRIATDRLLLRGVASPPDGKGWTRSLPAWQAWQWGQRALNSWSLDEADTALTKAMAFDTAFTRPALWLAVVRTWAGTPPAGWKALLDRASGQPDQLSVRELRIVSALGAEAEQSWGRACSAWRDVARTDPNEFTGWFGLASCLRADNAVVLDHHSPSGWSFRSSAQEMTQAYGRAFELQPSTQGSGSSARFEQVRDLLYARGNQIRVGFTVPNGEMMMAQPGLSGDTLILIPYPAARFRNGAEETQSPTRREALLRQRHRLNQLAASWVTSAPRNPRALEALAFSLQLLGDPSALDTLRRARGLAVDRGDQVRLSIAEVWLRLAPAMPDDLEGLRLVRSLADSLLGDPRPENAEGLSAIAALLGRADLAARLSSQANIGIGVPEVRSLVRDAPALLTYASLGGPSDSIRRLESAVSSAIGATTLEAERVRARQQWLERAARIAFPDVRLTELARLGRAGDPLLEAQAAMAEGRPEPARRYLASLPAQRKYLAPEEIAPEALYAEARLFVLLGDKTAAGAWLDPMLQTVRRMDIQSLSRLTSAATLMRAVVLRADLADQAGDRAQAARWARMVNILWDNADDFLQPTIRRMDGLAGIVDPNSRRP